MRLKNELLDKADYQYITIRKGQQVVVQLFHEPQPCVRISTDSGSQCYPLTQDQWKVYIDYAQGYVQQDVYTLERSYIDAQIKEQQYTGYCARFWHNVAQTYKQKLEALWKH